MLSEYDIAATDLSLFVGFNLFFAVFCAIWFVRILLFYPCLLLKPSMFLLACTHIFFQWPTAIFSGFSEDFLLEPAILSVLVHTYMVVGLLISSVTRGTAAQKLWSSLVDEPSREKLYSFLATLVLGIGIVIVAFQYFFYVAYDKTGLYALIFDPTKSDLARNYSFEVLPQWMKYGYSLAQSCLVPLFCSMALLYFLSKSWGKRLLIFPFPALLIAGGMIMVSLTGARYSMVKVLAVLMITFLFYRRFRISPIHLILGGTIILLPPALITLVREGREADLISLFDYLFNGILVHRILSVPLQVGLWHLDYAQLEGSFGIGAIPKLAQFFDIPALRVPHIIGEHYLPGKDVATYSDAGYLFSYYSYFGLISLPVSIALTMVLDLSLLVYRKLRPAILIPCISAICLSVLEFVQSDYTTVIITHGFIPILAACICLEVLLRLTAKTKELLSNVVRLLLLDRARVTPS